VKKRANRIKFKDTFKSHADALKALNTTGDAALVVRGIPRTLLIRCPCGCGDDLVLNLDGRIGKAWRLYRRGRELSLYPSYWRDSGCESHFILWKNQVHWCDWDDDGWWSSESPIEDRVLEALSWEFVNYFDLADRLGEVPWAVLQACNLLVRKGNAIVNSPTKKGEFRRSD
jgi:hypothetical protein